MGTIVVLLMSTVHFHQHLFLVSLCLNYSPCFKFVQCPPCALSVLTLKVGTFLLSLELNLVCIIFFVALPEAQLFPFHTLFRLMLRSLRGTQFLSPEWTLTTN